ncbi:transglutaminase family protein [Marinicrinis sediminis]|uniref:Transglutaminase domain-containing protein n=1 Tax=Marinicrinis sediminis TaxID=1652465 RepID=A0ABW5R7P3_9BACL
MLYVVEQVTHYQYESTVTSSINKCRMMPIQDFEQRCLSYELEVDPQTTVYHHQDYWHNPVQTFYIHVPHEELRIVTRSVVRLSRQVPTESMAWSFRESLALFGNRSFQGKYAEFLQTTAYTKLDQEAARQVSEPIWQQSRHPLAFVKELNRYIYQHFSYEAGTSTVHSTAQDLWDKRKGVCQDFTHFMLAICRYRGIPARYVSGYVYCGEDAAMRGDSATHAWVEVYIPGIGWVGFDPTNHKYAVNQHIRMAIGRDYLDIVPLKGVYEGGKQTLSVKVSIHLQQERG